MLFNQVAKHGEDAAKHARAGAVGAAANSLELGIALLDQSLQSARQRHASDAEAQDLRAHLYAFHARLCNLKFNSGEFFSALQIAFKLCALDNRNSQGFLFAGQCLRKLQRYEEAVNYLKGAQECDPTSAQIKQALELAVTEMRFPSSVNAAAAAPRSSPAAAAPAASLAGSGLIPEDEPIEFLKNKLLASYIIPRAKQAMKLADANPHYVLGGIAAVVLLLILIFGAGLFFFIFSCAAVVQVHRWEKKHMEAIAGQMLIAPDRVYRIPVLDVPLQIVTSVCLAVAAVHAF